MSSRGYCIVVEGIEGAGKSCALQAIQQYLSNFVTEIIVTREPGGTIVGDTVRKLIKEPCAQATLDPKAELLLLYASRVQLLEQVIYPALQRNAWVLSDRFELSTFAYQGGGRQLDKQMITMLSAFCVKDFKPDLTIYLDVTPELGLARVRQRGSLDRLEQESLTFFSDVWHEYKARIAAMDNVICINANQAMDIVHQEIMQQLKTFVQRHAIE